MFKTLPDFDEPRGQHISYFQFLILYKLQVQIQVEWYNNLRPNKILYLIWV